jgi:ABC-type glycerol-3-phosphate transport system substrate-binding protein
MPPNITEFFQTFFSNRRNVIISAVVGVLIFVMLLVVIFGGQKPVAKIAEDSSPVVLTWWKQFYGTAEYSTIIEDFKKLPGNQNVSINIVTKKYGDEYYQNLIEDFAANAGPDIFSIRNDELPQYKKFMAPINTFKSGDKFIKYKNDFVPLVTRSTIDRDNVYAVASYVDNLQLYYNEALLNQAGISLPPKTWLEMRNQLPLLNIKDNTGTQFKQSAISFGTGGLDKDGISNNINRYQDILPALIFQAGGQLYDYTNQKSVFGNGKNQKEVSTGLATTNSFNPDTPDSDNPAYRAMKFYAEFADPNSNKYSWNALNNNNTDMFIDGRLAYMVSYSYFQDQINARNDRLKYKIAELPQLDSSIKKTYGTFFMDGLNRDLQRQADANPKDTTKSKKYRKAQEFLEYLTTKSAVESFVNKAHLPAARKDVVQNQINGDEKLQYFAYGALYADNYYKENAKKTEKIWSDMFYRYQFENIPLPQALNKAITEYNALLISN